MRVAKLEQILENARSLTILVVGDFFLDHYLYIDPKLDEQSLETCEVAYQVTQVSSSPGAAGNVVKNLHAIGVNSVVALGVIGNDGYGQDLIKALNNENVDVGHLFRCPTRMTPTYIKPLRKLEMGFSELNRLDIKNRLPTSQDLEEKIVDALHYWAPRVDGIVVTDQVEETNCGVITSRVRFVLGELAIRYPDLPIIVDSRVNIGKYTGVMVKPNEREGVRALGLHEEFCDRNKVVKQLYQRTNKPVFLTCGERGQFVFDGQIIERVEALPVSGPIDIVGAGDSTISGIITALASGATYSEAAFFGNLIASITIQKLGTTGTANPDEIMDRFNEWCELKKNV